MREIKFRGWNPLEEDPHFFYFDLETIRDEDNEANWQNMELVMQYTGLKDKNGKEIYEGDILDAVESTEVFHPNRMVVEYHGMAFAFVGKTKREQPLRSEYTFDTITNSDIETYPAIVIGNIYENPELWTKKD